MGLRYLLYKLIDIYSLVLIARVLISWFRVNPYNPVIQFLCRITDPLLDRIRGFMPGNMTIDFSPLVALLLLRVLQSFILRF